MVSNILVNHTRIKNGKLSVRSKGFFLKALSKFNLKEYLKKKLNQMIRVKHL